MPSGIPIDGKSFIGYEFYGVKIIDVYKTDTGKWGAQVQCSCGKVFKTTLRYARSLCGCPHNIRRKKHD